MVFLATILKVEPSKSAAKMVLGPPRRSLETAAAVSWRGYREGRAWERVLRPSPRRDLRVERGILGLVLWFGMDCWTVVTRERKREKEMSKSLDRRGTKKIG
jgi:hypothetical protein